MDNLFLPPLDESSFKEVSPIMLAFIGDAVHTFFVRDQVVKSGNLKLKDYHKKSANLCKASAQAQKLDQIYSLLLPNEVDVVRRARNVKVNTIAKNSTLETYKKATSYEALIGYLYLQGNFKRLKEVL